MVFPMMVASKIVTYGGRESCQKLVGLRCSRCCCFCFLAKSYGWVASVEVKLSVMMGGVLGGWVAATRDDRGFPA